MTEVTSGVRVMMRHLRAAKICSGGSREWFARHSLNWNQFLAEGVPAEILEATGDPFAIRAVEQARAENDG